MSWSKEYGQKYRSKNKDRIREVRREWYLRNKKIVSAKGRERYCRHRDRIRTQSQKYRESNRDLVNRQKVARRLFKYGITIEQRDSLLQKQEGRCAICWSTISGRNVCVDHAHISGVVRGILCSNCNVGIGQFKESTIRLQSAIDYLKKHQRHVGGNDSASHGP